MCVGFPVVKVADNLLSLLQECVRTKCSYYVWTRQSGRHWRSLALFGCSGRDFALLACRYSSLYFFSLSFCVCIFSLLIVVHLCPLICQHALLIDCEKMGTKREGESEGRWFLGHISLVHPLWTSFVFGMSLDFLVFIVSHVIGGSIVPWHLAGWMRGGGQMTTDQRRGLIIFACLLFFSRF